VRRWGRVACVMRRLWSPLARSDTLKKSSCVSLGTTSRVVDLNVRSSQALICRVVQEDASYAVKIGNGNSRNMRTDFISTSTAFVASPHHHLATSARSSPHLAFSGAATFVHQTQLRASSSAFCACVSTFLVDLEPLVRCVNGLTCVDRSRFSQVTVLQWTSRSEGE